MVHHQVNLVTRLRVKRIPVAVHFPAFLTAQKLIQAPDEQTTPARAPGNPLPGRIRQALSGGPGIARPSDVESHLQPQICRLPYQLA